MNNYDNKKGGIGISVNIFYDYDTGSRMEYYSEAFKPLRDYRDNKSRVLIYIGYDDISGLDTIYDIVSNARFSAKKKELAKLTGLSMEHTREELLEYYKDDVIQSYSVNEILDGDIDSEIEFDFEIISSTGYFQGDYIQIIIPKGVKYDKEYIHNLLWDSPIAGTITIDNKEFYVDELLSSQYLSEDEVKDECIKYVKKEYPKASEEFNKMMEGYSIEYN